MGRTGDIDRDETKQLIDKLTPELSTSNVELNAILFAKTSAMSDTDRKALLSKNESWYNPRQEVVREAMEYGVPLHVQINADAGIRLYGVINRSEQPYVETDQEDDSPLHLAEIQLDSHGDLQAQLAHLRDIRSVLHHADQISDKSYGLTMKDVTKNRFRFAG